MILEASVISTNHVHTANSLSIMTSLVREPSESSRTSTTAGPISPQIAYPEPTSQPNSGRLFFMPDNTSHESSRRPRHSASVPYFLRPEPSHEDHSSANAANNTDLPGGFSSSFNKAFPNSPSFSQLGKFKIKLPYGSARQKFNKFITRGLLPSFLYSSESSSPHASSQSSSSRKKASSPPKTETGSASLLDSNNFEGSNNTGPSSRQLPVPTKLAASSYSTPNLLSVQRPVETASVTNLRASRSRQGSVSTTYTTNETHLAQTSGDGYLNLPPTLSNDSNSLYCLNPLDSSNASYNSSLSSASNYYTQQYHQHHQQKQLKHAHSLMDDSESGVAFLSEDFQNVKPPAKIDFVQLCPTEIVDEIFSHLDRSSIIACLQVNKAWKAAIDSNTIWRSLFFQNRYWNTVSSHLPDEQMTWKEIYRTREALDKRWIQGKVKAKALKGHSDSVYCVHYNEDIIVTGSRDQTIKVWDARSGALLKTRGRIMGRAPELDEEEGAEPAESANAQLPFTTRTAFLTPSTNTSPAPVTPQETDQLLHTKSVLCLNFDKTLMVSGSSDWSIILWSLPDFLPFKRITRHTAGVLDVVLSDDYICSCSRDGTINVWDRPHGKYDTSTPVEFKKAIKGHDGPVNSIQMRGDIIFSAGGDALVKMWSITEGTCLRQFSGHFRGLACIQLSPDGKTLVSGSNDRQIRVWDVETSRCLHVLEGHTALVRTLDVTSGKIISGSYDQSIRIWDLETGEQLVSMDHYFGSWIFSAKADLKRIICTSFGSKPVILDFTLALDKKCLDFLVS